MQVLPFLRNLGLSAVCAASASALTIELDYSHDEAASDFFGTYTDARNALEQAAADISALINSTLGSISESNSQGITGTVNSTSVTFDWKLTYTNPSTGATVELTDFSAATDTVTIYVGARNLSGTTLGQGGPGGAGFSLSGGGFESDWVAAMNAAVSASNSIMRRGGIAPDIGTFSGSSTLGSTTANYDLFWAPTIGNLWFDDDTDNDGDTDSAAELNAYWHFNHTTAVATDKIDFYSVALHEILHALGYGTALTWTNLVSGTEWLGANGIAENGTGVGLIDAGGAHLAASISSTTLADGSTQEVVMDPNITTGVRKTLTALDLAILLDLKFTAVPEPGHYALILGALSLAGVVCRRRRSV